ncbi:MAG: hypothetical protein V3V31_06120, partial [Methylococcales bacterium]
MTQEYSRFWEDILITIIVVDSFSTWYFVTNSCTGLMPRSIIPLSIKLDKEMNNLSINKEKHSADFTI